MPWVVSQEGIDACPSEIRHEESGAGGRSHRRPGINDGACPFECREDLVHLVVAREDGDVDILGGAGNTPDPQGERATQSVRKTLLVESIGQMFSDV
jgi:hypothetical protein